MSPGFYFLAFKRRMCPAGGANNSKSFILISTIEDHKRFKREQIQVSVLKRTTSISTRVADTTSRTKLSVNVLDRTTSISTFWYHVDRRSQIYVSMSLIGRPPFLRSMTTWISLLQRACVNVLDRTTSISTVPSGRPHK